MMRLATSVPMASMLRVLQFYARHGLNATVRRAFLGLHRAVFARRFVVFYCDLALYSRVGMPPKPLQVERVHAIRELNESDLRTLTTFWNPEEMRRRMQQRFAKSASLWLIRSAGDLAGFGWSLQGGTVEPYYFPLAVGDVHLFDFHVFPKFRGNGLNRVLVKEILSRLAEETRGRAFIEAAEWNLSQLASLGKMPVTRLGVVRQINVLGYRMIHWTRATATSYPGTAIAHGSMAIPK